MANKGNGKRRSALRETTEISEADALSVATVWEIPEAQRLAFAVWLRNVMGIYDFVERSYRCTLTRQQKKCCFAKVEKTARALEQRLKDPWIVNYMIGHEELALGVGFKARKIPPRKDIKTARGELVERASDAIDKRVRRDVRGVTHVAKRLREIVREIEARADNADEQIAARGALKVGRRRTK